MIGSVVGKTMLIIIAVMMAKTMPTRHANMMEKISSMLVMLPTTPLCDFLGFGLNFCDLTILFDNSQ